MSATDEMCGNEKAGYTLYCTKPHGHAGDHVATAGPYRTYLAELGRWPNAASKVGEMNVQLTVDLVSTEAFRRMEEQLKAMQRSMEQAGNSFSALSDVLTPGQRTAPKPSTVTPRRAMALAGVPQEIP